MHIFRLSHNLHTTTRGKKLHLYEYIFAYGYSQQELAEKTGVSQSTLSRYMMGVSIPNVLFAVRIENATEGQVTCHDWAELPHYTKKQRNRYRMDQRPTKRRGTA